MERVIWILSEINVSNDDILTKFGEVRSTLFWAVVTSDGFTTHQLNKKLSYRRDSDSD